MADMAHAYTDKQIEKLQHEIEIVYKQAEIDVRHKMKEFEKNYRVKESIYKKEVNQGKITQEQFDNWKKGQVFQREQWKAKRESILDTMSKTNQIAVNMINGQTTNVFAVNANYTSYSIEHGAGVNFGFGLYDSASVVNLIKDNPKLLPKWKINEPKDYIWSQKKLNRAITQGIIQGESIKQISDRLSNKLVSSNKDKMLTFARTAMTGAQNSGRLTSMRAAKDLGIDLEKEWMATLDSHTRDSHADVDGERVPLDSKFSNGLEYPGEPGGAPAEVYNCRCTMVSNVKKYPAEYKRYNNIDGKQIENMTYNEWVKAKGLKKDNSVDYSKYGGKDVFDIMKKYGDYDNFVNNSTTEEFDKVWSIFDSTYDVSEAFANAQVDFDKVVSEVDKYAKAESELKALEDKMVTQFGTIQVEFDALGAKTYDGIWAQSMKVSDYASKEGSFNAKEQYYIDQINALKSKDVLSHIDELKLKDLEEKYESFKQYKLDVEQYKLLQSKLSGSEYNALKTAIEEKNNELKALKIQSLDSSDKFSQERKDAAIWAKSPKEADDFLRPTCGDVWRSASAAEKDGIYEYTASFSKFNEPLRGWEYGQSNYRTGTGFKGVGNTDLNAGRANNGKRLNAMTDIINKSSYTEDIWLQRGCHFDGMDRFFNVDMSLLKNGTEKELQDALLGTTPTEYGFMSCGSSKGRGFSGDILLNVYAPAGTKMMYVEPFSDFGNGAMSDKWDGIATQNTFGSELETILQQGTQFRVVKVERTGSQIYVDLEVIDQSVQQKWIP